MTKIQLSALDALHQLTLQAASQLEFASGDIAKATGSDSISGTGIALSNLARAGYILRIRSHSWGTRWKLLPKGRKHAAARIPW